MIMGRGTHTDFRLKCLWVHVIVGPTCIKDLRVYVLMCRGAHMYEGLREYRC